MEKWLFYDFLAKSSRYRRIFLWFRTSCITSYTISGSFPWWFQMNENRLHQSCTSSLLYPPWFLMNRLKNLWTLLTGSRGFLSSGSPFVVDPGWDSLSEFSLRQREACDFSPSSTIRVPGLMWLPSPSISLFADGLPFPMYAIKVRFPSVAVAIHSLFLDRPLSFFPSFMSRPFGITERYVSSTNAFLSSMIASWYFSMHRNIFLSQYLPVE